MAINSCTLIRDYLDCYMDGSFLFSVLLLRRMQKFIAFHLTRRRQLAPFAILTGHRMFTCAACQLKPSSEAGENVKENTLSNFLIFLEESVN